METILVRFGAPHVQPHDPSMAWSDSYPLLSVHLIQKWITFVTQDKIEILCCHAMETTLVHFGQFWCFLVHLMCDFKTPP